VPKLTIPEIRQRILNLTAELRMTPGINLLKLDDIDNAIEQARRKDFGVPRGPKKVKVGGLIDGKPSTSETML